MAPSTETHSSMAACPPLEDIAAFLDGNLSPEESARITEHLARCESCYEIFSGAIHFQEEEHLQEEEEPVAAFPMPAVKEVALPADPGGVLPLPLAQEKIWETKARIEPARPTRRASRRLPLAASIVLAVGLGWRLFAAPPEITLEEVVEPIETKAGISDLLYKGNVSRGPGNPGSLFLFPGPEFMVGVHLLDLRLSVKTNNVAATATRLQDMGNELQEVTGLPGMSQRYYGEYGKMNTSADLDRFAAKLPDWETELQDSLADFLPFQFGLWAEASRLAARMESPEFFKTRKNRRFLSRLQKALPDQLAPELQQPVLENLQVIERTWDEGDLSEQDFQTLETHFQKIIERIDEYQEDV